MFGSTQYARSWHYAGIPDWELILWRNVVLSEMPLYDEWDAAQEHVGFNHTSLGKKRTTEWNCFYIHFEAIFHFTFLFFPFWSPLVLKWYPAPPGKETFQSSKPEGLSGPQSYRVSSEFYMKFFGEKKPTNPQNLKKEGEIVMSFKISPMQV